VNLTTDDIATINHARKILNGVVAEIKYSDDYGLARVATIAEIAEHGLFDFLNNASTWANSGCQTTSCTCAR